MARTMICGNDFLKCIWVEAMNISNNVLNICFIRPILEKTPSELFKGKKPKVLYFKVVGCICFIHNNGKKSLGKMPEVTKAPLLDILNKAKDRKFIISIPR